MQYLSFCVWLISLSIMSSRFIHTVTNGRISYSLDIKNIIRCYVKLYDNKFENLDTIDS